MDTSKVLSAIRDAVAALGYEIVEISYKKQYDDWHLTVFVWQKSGIGLDDCERVHHAIDPILEEIDPTGGAPYVLNVSSQGLDRPIKSDRDFERALDTDIEVKLYAPIRGVKRFEGRLSLADSHMIRVVTKDGEVDLEKTKIALARPLIKF